MYITAVAKLRKALEDEDVRKKEEDIASPCKETLEREDTAEVEDKGTVTQYIWTQSLGNVLVSAVYMNPNSK